VSQKEKISQFTGVTGTTQAKAREFLQASQWNVEVAINNYYSGNFVAPTLAVTTNSAKGGGKSGVYRRVENTMIFRSLIAGYLIFSPVLLLSTDQPSLAKTFQSYKADGEQVIQAEGIMRLLDAIGLDPLDPVVLVLCYHMEAATQGVFTQEEFERGFTALRCRSVDELKSKVSTLKASMKDDNTFKKVYNYCYGFSCTNGQKILQLDTAVAMWRLLFADRAWPHLDAWLNFLETNHKRAVSKDTWSLFLDFTRHVRPDFSNYDLEGGAWPYLFDEFVEKMKEKQ